MHSINTMANLVLGEINQDRNAAGGTVPDRMKDRVRFALRVLWNRRDWVWQIRIGTLTIAASATTATLADDYRKMDSRWLKDQSKSNQLLFTNNTRTYLDYASRYKSTDTGPPKIACITRDMTDHTNFDWYVRLAPASDQAYSPQYSYLAMCPIDLAAAHADLKADGDLIPMPEYFTEGWHLLSMVYAHRAFTPGETSWQSAQMLFKDWMDGAINENNETLTDPTEPLADGYGDLGALIGADGAVGDIGHLVNL